MIRPKRLNLASIGGKDCFRFVLGSFLEEPGLVAQHVVFDHGFFKNQSGSFPPKKKEKKIDVWECSRLVDRSFTQPSTHLSIRLLTATLNASPTSYISHQRIPKGIHLSNQNEVGHRYGKDVQFFRRSAWSSHNSLKVAS